MDDNMRITINETANAVQLRLEGRVAGPWADELSRVWQELAPSLAPRSLTIDLNNVIYADEAGKQILRAIYTQSNAHLFATTPWTEYLAEEIAAPADTIQEDSNAAHA